MKGALTFRQPASQTPAKRNSRGIDRDKLISLLQIHFGHSSYRGLQLDAIEAVLSGKDCFCLMPTGAGKSICYEIPAVAKTGIVLVVSPLIALMENQVSALKGRNISAEYLSSAQSTAIKSKIYEEMNSGKPTLKLLYVTPEQLSTGTFIKKLKPLHERGLLTLVAIDEAHCISSWGHDFRPSYRKLSEIRNYLPGVPILALTATADKKVQRDIVKSLCLHQPSILVSSFNRPNIFYEVRFKDLVKSPYTDLLDTIKCAPRECGIIYCHTRANCDQIGTSLKQDGISCRVYHAGVSDKVRSQVLEEWASGKVPIIVATVAFGMGIDKKDVRLVCHYDMPKTLEGFYQESGRAGRDQKPSLSILYYGVQDRKTMEFTMRSSHNKQKAKNKDAADGQLKRNLESFQKVVEYCEQLGCRREKVLRHFGEEATAALCSKNCDACKWPQQLDRKIKELKEAVESRKQGFSSVIISQNSYEKKKGDGSEFWKYEEEEEEEENDEDTIDTSDEEASELATSVVSKCSNVKMEKKMEALLSMEESLNAKRQRSENDKKNKNEKNVVSEEHRSATVEHVENALERVFKRLGYEQDGDEEGKKKKKKKIAGEIEEECFRKFGKSGRSFYNSGVASQLRRFSTFTLPHLHSFLSSLHTT